MSVQNYDELRTHYGHDIEVVLYGNVNVAVECQDCSEVILDFDKGE